MRFISVSDKQFVKNCGKITWRKSALRKHVNEVAFKGDSSLPPEIMQLRSPIEIFNLFFDDEILDMIVLHTNHAARVKNIETRFTVSSNEIRQFIGILVFMSVVRCPNTPFYWGQYGIPTIQNAMPRNKFNAIKQYLSFADASKRKKRGEDGYDAIFRIRALSDGLNAKFDAIPKTARLCVDEQMCSTKARHHLRQYMPNKPHKWGVKLFVLCDSHGYAYRFEIYNGAGDNRILPGMADLGACANVVVQ